MSRRRNQGKPKPFGTSKHRKARILRFSFKHRESGKAFGGKDPKARELLGKQPLEPTPAEREASEARCRELGL